jgi:hypothetical protein
MLAFFKNTKIGVRIVSALALPVIGLLFFSGYVVLTEQRNASEMGRVLRLAPPISPDIAYSLY